MEKEEEESLSPSLVMEGWSAAGGREWAPAHHSLGDFGPFKPQFPHLGQHWGHEPLFTKCQRGWT